MHYSVFVSGNCFDEDGNAVTRTYSFPSPIISVADLQAQIFDRDGIPEELQRLSHNCKELRAQHELFLSENVPTFVQLSMRLLGGKGGFGSLLRGSSTKVGQKKNTNFDACRDLNGRRLRHVHNEQRLAEWYERKAREAASASNGETSAPEQPAVPRQIEEQIKTETMKTIQKVREELSESIKAALEEEKKNKKKQATASAQKKDKKEAEKEEISNAKKRKCMWTTEYDDDISDDDDDEESDGDDEQEENASKKNKNKKERKSSSSPSVEESLEIEENDELATKEAVVTTISSANKGKEKKAATNNNNSSSSSSSSSEE